MASLVLTSTVVTIGTAWSVPATAPGEPGTQTIAGTITTNSTDLSTYTTKAEMPWSAAMVEFTNFGSGAFKVEKPGIKSAVVNLGFNQDYAASALDVLLRSTIGFGALIYLDIKATSAARSATNPSYVCQAYLTSYTPVMASVGGKAELSVSWPVSGAFGVLTA